MDNLNSDWKCPYCSTKNSHQRTICSKCYRFREVNINVTSTNWKCAKCDNINFVSQTYCENCRKLREDHSINTSNSVNKSKEICRSCGSVMIKGSCLNCEKRNADEKYRMIKFRGQSKNQISGPQSEYLCKGCHLKSPINKALCKYCQNQRPEYYCRRDNMFSYEYICFKCKTPCQVLIA